MDGSNMLLERNEAYLEVAVQASGSGVTSGYTEDVVSDREVQVLDTKREEIEPVRLLQQALNLSLKRQEMLFKLKIKLANLLKENQEKQEGLRKKLYPLKHDSCYKPKVEPTGRRNLFYKFGIPYFEDPPGFGGPSNKDYKTKIKNKELIVIDLPKVKFWKKVEKKILQEGVKECLIKEQTDQFNYRIKKLKEFLANSDGDKSNTVMDELHECQEKLHHVNKKSFKALIANEPNDREYDWMKISVINFNGDHSPEECQRYWHLYLKPSINKGNWEMTEDLKLSELVQEYKFQDWDNIANALGTNRSAYQCFVHSQTRIYSKNNYTTGKWTNEEDKMLLSLINASKISDYIPWPKVATRMESRTNIQVYRRWRNSLNPILVKGKFTKDEDMLIVAGIKVLKASYPQLATLLERRTNSQIQERYVRLLQRSTSNIGPWSLVEDEQLMDLIKEHGESNWKVISKHIGTRTRTQVRQRYSFIRKMKECNPEWTICCVKRKTKYHAPKQIKLTKKYVEKFREKYANLEEFLNMTKFERDTFSSIILPNLRRKFKQTRQGRQKTVLSDGAPVNNMLLDYFKPSKDQGPRTKKGIKTYSRLPVRVSLTRSVKRKRLNEMDTNNIEINDQPESSKTVAGNGDEPNSTETVNSPMKRVRGPRKKCGMESKSSNKSCEERSIRPICNIRSPVNPQSRTSCLRVTSCAPKLRVQQQRRCKKNVENTVGGVTHKPEEREDEELDTQIEV